MTVGTITAAEGSVVINGAAETGNIAAQTLTVTSSLNTTSADVGNPSTIAVQEVTATDGAAITADSVVIGGATGATAAAAATSSVISAGTHAIDNLILVANTVTPAEGESTVADIVLTIDGDATVNAGVVTLTEGAVINVGTEGASGSAGTLITLELNLSNGGFVWADPAWTSTPSVVHAQGLTGSVIGANGGIGVTQNAYGIIGLSDDETDAFMAAYPLSEHGLNAALAIGQKLHLDGGTLLVDGVEQTEAAGKVVADSVYLGNDTMLYLTQDTADTLYGPDAAITFDNNNGTIYAAGGEIVVGGPISANSTLNIAQNADGTAVEIAGAEDNTDGTLVIRSENGLFSYIADSDTESLMGIELSIAPDARSKLSGLSDPMFAYAMDIYSNAYAGDGAGVEYVQTALGQGNGSNIETAARLATFGGAVQVGMLASDTTNDLIADRVGMAKSNANMVYADNTDGAGIWLAPVYRNSDSDEFDAQGVDYGADIDLYGVAFGVDNTTKDGVRYGAMFNVGSGDADGQGVGSSVSNDFDYYSIAAYVGAEVAPNFNVTGDISYTKVDNDLDAFSGLDGWGKLEASADTEVLSLGVTGQYKFETKYLDVMQHLGMRFSRLELDDYTVRSSGQDIAYVDNDSVNVFSVPLGVTLSKDFSFGAWKVKPVFDLTLTVNAGDDELDSYTVFDGADFGTALNAEFIDDVTYGATLGVAAANDDLSFGLDLNYTGSSNTDEFGVGANVRYSF